MEFKSLEGNKIVKKINNFFDKANLFKIWLVLYPIISLIVYGFFYIGISLVDEVSKVTNPLLLKIGLGIGFIFSLAAVTMISSMRKSIMFWNYSKHVEELIKNVNTKEELEKIYYNEYNELVDKCMGGPQIPKVMEIKTFIETRLKYWKDYHLKETKKNETV